MKNNKKTNPKADVISEIKEEFTRHTTALMEHMTKEVKTVAEGHSIIMKKLEEHDNRFDNQDKKFAKVESELQSISMAVMDTGERVKSIENKVDGHETRIKKIEDKVFV